MQGSVKQEAPPSLRCGSSRNLRLDSGEMMKEMATKLNVSSSFLSNVENGKEKVPEIWYEKIVVLYKLDRKKQEKLITAIKKSQKPLKVNVKNKRLEDMSKEEIENFKIFLKKSHE